MPTKPACSLPARPFTIEGLTRRFPVPVKSMFDDPTRLRTTALLRSLDVGESKAALYAVVYEELRELAHRQLGHERGNHTLQTTDLVHEAYLRLIDDTLVDQRGRAYFFAAAGQAMRRILVEHARRRSASKRGSNAEHLDLDEVQIAVDSFADELLALDRALERLAALNVRHARVVECRFFAGMSVEETAAALAISERTVKYDWAFARAWLYEELRVDRPSD